MTKTKDELEERIKFLESCCDAHSKIQHEILDIVVPHLNFPRGKTINFGHVIQFLKEHFNDN